MDSTAGAAAFTRGVLDLTRRLAALDVLISEHHTPAQVAQWIITTGAEILRHSSSTAAAAQPRSSESGRGGERRGGRGGGRGGSGGRGGAGRGTAAFTPCHYLPLYGPTRGQRCNQTTHVTETCFKALSDEWFACGKSSTPPRYSAVNPCPTPQDDRISSLYTPPSSTQAHQALTPPSQQKLQRVQHQGPQQYGQ
ncbi:unnamed protein product [Closterium sp. NIES-54]